MEATTEEASCICIRNAWSVARSVATVAVEQWSLARPLNFLVIWYFRRSYTDSVVTFRDIYKARPDPTGHCLTDKPWSYWLWYIYQLPYFPWKVVSALLWHANDWCNKAKPSTLKAIKTSKAVSFYRLACVVMSTAPYYLVRLCWYLRNIRNRRCRSTQVS